MDWAAFSGPEYYEPREVVLAFAELERIRDDLYVNHVYNRILSAVGNNHAGTAYPAAVAAVTKLAHLVLAGRGLVRATAASILVSLLQFAPEPGFESFWRTDGTLAHLAEELARSIKQFEAQFLELVADPNETDEVRLDLVLAIRRVADPVRLAVTLRAVLSSELSTSLERELRAVLDDLP